MMKKLAAVLTPLVVWGLLLVGPAKAQTAEEQQNTPVEAPQQNTAPAVPGSINYVDGSASIGSQELNEKSPGRVVLQRNETLSTQDGRVEMLLNPGVFVRLDHNSAVRMISPNLENTEISVEGGVVSVEVVDLFRQNNIRIDLGDSNTKIEKKGLYEFDANENQVRVFSGKAQVFVGDKKYMLGKERELALNTGRKLKEKTFDARKYENDFFRWAALRSGYLSEATLDASQRFVGNGPDWYGAGWVGPGWYWDPWFYGYTFLPGDGMFYSPFGWGFYSPLYIYRTPYYYRGFYGHEPHPFNRPHFPYGHGFEPRGGFHGGGFHGAPRGGGGFHGGRFHGGGTGGFHGGGMGGGRR